jgi:hypothetical protein
MIMPVGCKKKEEPRQQTPPPPGHGITIPKADLKIVVPETVKGEWKAVKLEVTDKSTNSIKEVTISLNSEYSIPDSNLKIKVGDFLPDFRMEGTIITSASNEPKNPAIQLTVLENGKEIFKGWLYSKFPSIHPFQHEKYSLRLIEGIKS